MKRPICPTHNIEMEASGRIMVKPGKYITSMHTCAECGYDTATPPDIINNAKRPPSPSKPKPKQRIRFDDAMAMIGKTAKHKFRKRFPGHNPPDNVDCITFLNRSEIEHIIKKLTR